jgi:hypothetical protein
MLGCNACIVPDDIKRYKGVQDTVRDICEATTIMLGY